jgi:hypothetical protein
LLNKVNPKSEINARLCPAHNLAAFGNHPELGESSAWRSSYSSGDCLTHHATAGSCSSQIAKLSPSDKGSSSRAQ